MKLTNLALYLELKIASYYGDRIISKCGFKRTEKIYIRLLRLLIFFRSFCSFLFHFRWIEVYKKRFIRSNLFHPSPSLSRQRSFKNCSGCFSETGCSITLTTYENKCRFRLKVTMNIRQSCLIVGPKTKKQHLTRRCCGRILCSWRIPMGLAPNNADFAILNYHYSMSTSISVVYYLFNIA